MAASLAPVYTEKKRQKNTPQRKKQDDPYYCGLLARIPNFIKSSKQQCANKPKKEPKISRKISAQHHQFLLAAQQQQQAPHTTTPIPIATFHHSYFPYKLYPPQHRLSQSQLSLWDARSLISAHGRCPKIYLTPRKLSLIFYNCRMSWKEELALIYSSPSIILQLFSQSKCLFNLVSGVHFAQFCDDKLREVQPSLSSIILGVLPITLIIIKTQLWIRHQR